MKRGTTIATSAGHIGIFTEARCAFEDLLQGQYLGLEFSHLIAL
jgi:hypothetical protein